MKISKAKLYSHMEKNYHYPKSQLIRTKTQKFTRDFVKVGKETKVSGKSFLKSKAYNKVIKGD